MMMGKKKCELCGGVARMYCESDQASLCWDCDGKVHGANFLVAKHTRCLLCSACQSHTPWKASGLRLGPTVSICEPCLARKNRNQNLAQQINDHRLRVEDDGAESYNDAEDEDDEESGQDDEEVDNQVVPAAVEEQQAPVMSSSSSVSNDGDLVVKRTRPDLDLNFSDEEICDSDDSRPLKRLSRDEASSRSTVVMNSVVRLQGGRKSNGCNQSS